MVSDDISWLEWAFKGLVVVMLTVGGWLWTMLVRAVSKNKDDLADHRLHVSENYAKKIEIRDVFDALDEVRKDIKILLGRHDK